MRKNFKITTAVLLTVLLLSLCGCSSDGTDSDAAQNGASSGAGEVTAEEGYTFTFGDTVVVMGAEADPIIESLGDNYDYFESESCAFEGLDKVYSYPGFKLNTYPLDEVDYVSSVVFRDDTVETEEGITIGSSRESVLEAYGDPSDEKSTSLVYRKGNTILTFGMSGDAVASVTIADDTNEG